MRCKDLKLKFLPSGTEVDGMVGAKVLAQANRSKVPIQFGCGAGTCGTCAVEIVSGKPSEMLDSERNLLLKMKLPVDGRIRLACQARVGEEQLVIDIGFQEKYSPDQGMLD